MPSRARAAASTGKQVVESDDGAAKTDTAQEETAAGQEQDLYVIGEGDGIHGADGLTVLASARPSGLYRFTWPYPCAYTLPDRNSQQVDPGTEVWWPDGAPDALWEFVSAEQPASEPGTDTTRE